MSTIKTNNIKTRFNDVTSLSIDSTGRVLSTSQRPAFIARGVSNTARVIGRVMLFDQNITVNRGDCYAAASGVFTAPIAGVYNLNYGLFASTVGLVGTTRFLSNLNIQRGSTRINFYESTIEQPTAGTGSGYAKLGFSINVYMLPNDLAYVACDTPILSTSANYAHFSGIFLG